MKRTWTLSMLAVLVACGGTPSAAPPPTAGGGAGSGRLTTDDREARGKQMDAAEGASRRDDLKRQVDRYVNDSKRQTADVEDKLLASARVALGEEKARGARDQSSVGATIRKLRAAGINPRLTANPDFQQGFLRPDGKAYGADLLKVPRDKNQEIRFVFSDFASQTTTITWASYRASQQQIGLHLQAVAVAGAVVANRRKYSLEPTPADAAIVKKALDEARRGDELAAAGAGMSAAMIAVTNGGKPPKVLEDMSRAVKQSLPSKATATDEEAKLYLEGFESGLGDARERYEAMLQASYGSDWEKSSMKGLLDQSFKIAEAATHQQSQTERRAERARHAESRAPMTTSTSAVKPTASDGFVEKAKSLLPSDGPLAGAIGVIDALKTGNAKGAIKGALVFVPPGPIKMGLGIISALL